MSSEIKYRPEIDGLRTLAVLPVVLFHAGFAINGGFLGVDIFYVISGFLITAIIYAEGRHGNFTFARFYERRIRRILPLLIVVVAVTSLVAWLMLSPNALDDYGKSVLATLFFVSNIYFWKTTEYFSQGAENKPLLHTWSLAVEEQFYIVFPIVLLIIMRLFRRYDLWILIACTIIGLAFAEIMSLKHATFSFYIFPTRAWELLSGAAGAVFVAKYGRKPNAIAAAAGLALIILAYISCDSTMVHPGIYTVPTIAGAILILLFADIQNLTGKILSNTWIVLLGKISYGIYLWHQPVLAFLRLWNFQPLSPVEGGLAVIATIALSYLTWRFVEAPFRNRKVFGIRQAYATLGFGAAALAAVAVIFSTVSVTNLPFRPREVKVSDDRNFCPNPVSLDEGRVKGCLLGDATVVPTAVLIGDSSANALGGALDEQAKVRGTSILRLSIDGCTQLTGVDYIRYSGESCGKLQSSVLSYVLRSKDITDVFLLNRWTLFLFQTGFDNGEGGIEHLVPRPRQYKGQAEPESAREADFKEAVRNTLQPLLSEHKRVHVIYPVPESGWVSDQYLQKRYLRGNFSDASTSYRLFQSRNLTARMALDSATSGLQVQKIYPEQAFCDEATGRCSVTRNGKPLYLDSGHLSRDGAKLIGVSILAAIQPVKVAGH